MSDWSRIDFPEFMVRRRGEGVGERHLQALETLAAFYEQVGLLSVSGSAPRPCDACPRRHRCWAGDHMAMALPAERDGIAMPWIGSDYFEPTRRVLVVGMNFDAWGGLNAHWLVCRAHIAAMDRGSPGFKGLAFSAGAMAYVHAVRRALDRDPCQQDEPIPSHQELAHMWEQCAFVQAVKCAPDRPASEPFDEMFEECPSLLLGGELEVLQPRVVLVLGRSPQPRNAVREHLLRDYSLQWGTNSPRMERDHFLLDGRRTELFSLNHPSSRTNRWWHETRDHLIASLRQDPLPSP